MPEPTQVAFTFKEIVEALLAKQGIREGYWQLAVEFGIAGANIGFGPPGSDLLPTAIVPIKQIVLARVDELTNLSVDAATIKPSPEKRAASRRTRKE